jgi:hypothetical protein
MTSATPGQGQFFLAFGVGMGGNIHESELQEASYPFDEYASAQVATIGFLESLSPGLQTRMRLGYAFSAYLKAEVDVIYVMGLARIGEQFQNGQTLLQTRVRSARMQVIPGICLSMGERRFSPYLRLGGALPFRYHIQLDVLELRSQGEVYQTLDIEARMLPGWAGRVGMTYRLAEWIGIFYELEYLNQQARLEKSVLTRYEIEGQDEFDRLAPFQVQGNFQEGWHRPPNQPQATGFDPQAPLELETTQEVVQVVGLNFGIVITFH